MNFKITIQPKGHQITADADETVLDAALRQGLILPYGCRNGACGACKGKVTAGAVEYPHGHPPALSAEETEGGAALFCQAQPRSDLEIVVREVQSSEEIAIRTYPCKVTRLERLAADVMRVGLKLPSNERMPFRAGQYIDILLPDGSRRAFSMANPPDRDEELELHIRHVPGGRFTGQVFNEMKEKQLLRIEGPHGNFHLRETKDRPAILIAGGTGFAPIKSVLEHAFISGEQRPLHLYWGARDVADLYLNELPEAWSREHTNFRYTPVLSNPGAASGWQGHTGWVTDVVAAERTDLAGCDIYMCGPPPMIDSGRKRFFDLGLPPQRLYFDSFDYAAAPR